MTKKVDAWMPLLVDAYLGDTQYLTTEQHGAYLLLLMTMWKRDGVLPNSDERLQQITRLAPARWKACRPVLMEFFTVSADGETISQKRLTAELQRAKAHSDAKAEAGARGAAKRWQKQSSANGTAIAEPSQSHWQTGAPTPTPSASQIPEARAQGVPPGHASAHEARTGEPEPDIPPPSAAAVACMAMKQAGLGPGVNPSDPRLLALLQQGATNDELAEAARTAAGKGKGWGYALAIAEGRRRDAASIALPQQAADPMAWRKSPESVRAKGAELGVEVRPGEMYDGFERRVVAAFRRRTAAAGATT